MSLIMENLKKLNISKNLEKKKKSKYYLFNYKHNRCL